MQPRRQCLVLTPAKPRPEHLELVAGMAQEFGFDLQQSSERRDRANDILQASFLFADVSGSDPGVLYDVGVAHTFGKRVFLVTDNLDTLAFDMAGNRTWVIDPASDNREVYRAMQRFLGTGQTIGPVRLYLGKHAFFGENLIGRRFAAFLIDVALIALIFTLGLLSFVDHPDPIRAFASQLMSGDIESGSWIENVLILVIYPLFAYFVLMTWVLGATVGQWLAGIRVVQTDTRNVTFGQSVGRTVLTLLIVWTYGGAFLSSMVAPGYRAAHDILSGTIVVRKNPR